MTAATIATCTLCPGSKPADGALLDLAATATSTHFTRFVCVECVATVWSHDWDRQYRQLMSYQMGTATRMEWLMRGLRARRDARLWVKAVRRLTESLNERSSGARDVPA